jgi:hypothetical protein
MIVSHPRRVIPMPPYPDGPERLDQIETRWSLLRMAHQPSTTVACPARNALAMLYRRAIRAYVGALVADPQDADELSQEILVRLLSGNFHRADPARGRFRDMLKVAVANLVRSFWSKRGRRAGDLHDVSQLADGSDETADAQWLAGWRSTLLDNAWAALQDHERSHEGSIAYKVLRLRADYPDDDSPQLAERLSVALGRLVRPEALRQQLHRARWRFAQFLIAEVARSVEAPTPERVEEELIEVGLIDYVRDFLPPDWHETGELLAAS